MQGDKEKNHEGQRGTGSGSGEGRELPAWPGSLSPGGAIACYAQVGGDTAAGPGATRTPRGGHVRPPQLLLLHKLYPSVRAQHRSQSQGSGV